MLNPIVKLVNGGRDRAIGVRREPDEILAIRLIDVERNEQPVR
jgi:hypothetical protein